MMVEGQAILWAALGSHSTFIGSKIRDRSRECGREDKRRAMMQQRMEELPNDVACSEIR